MNPLFFLIFTFTAILQLMKCRLINQQSHFHLSFLLSAGKEMVPKREWACLARCGSLLAIIIIIIISNLSEDRSTASSKTIPPLNAI
jgi:hypothetical protein